MAEYTDFEAWKAAAAAAGHTNLKRTAGLDNWVHDDERANWDGTRDVGTVPDPEPVATTATTITVTESTFSAGPVTFTTGEPT